MHHILLKCPFHLLLLLSLLLLRLYCAGKNAQCCSFYFTVNFIKVFLELVFVTILYPHTHILLKYIYIYILIILIL